jgi:hypothetical protein
MSVEKFTSLINNLVNSTSMNEGQFDYNLEYNDISSGLLKVKIISLFIITGCTLFFGLLPLLW